MEKPQEQEDLAYFESKKVKVKIRKLYDYLQESGKTAEQLTEKEWEPFLERKKQ